MDVKTEPSLGSVKMNLANCNIKLSIELTLKISMYDLKYVMSSFALTILPPDTLITRLEGDNTSGRNF